METQFLYFSYWRAPIVIIMAAHIYFWGTGKRQGLAMPFLNLGYAVSLVAQIVLFFRHLY